MISLQLTIESESEAFGADPIGEAARVLRAAADHLESATGWDYGTREALIIRDINGNRCGELTVTARVDSDE